MIISKAVDKLQRELEMQITESSLRFYDMNGYIKLDRSDNTYRDISDKDLIKLQRILMLSDVNIDLAVVREILNDNKEAIKETVEELRKKSRRIKILLGLYDN